MAYEEATVRLIEFHSDPSHGWLRVPLELVGEAAPHISPHSYIDSEFAYLEEDSDAVRWLVEFRRTAGKSWGEEVKEVNQRTGESPIRRKERFSYVRYCRFLTMRRSKTSKV